MQDARRYVVNPDRPYGALDGDIIQTPGRLNNPAGSIYAFARQRANIDRRNAYARACHADLQRRMEAART